jgi:hypothetical protein
LVASKLSQKAKDEKFCKALGIVPAKLVAARRDILGIAKERELTLNLNPGEYDVYCIVWENECVERDLQHFLQLGCIYPNESEKQLVVHQLNSWCCEQFNKPVAERDPEFWKPELIQKKFAAMAKESGVSFQDWELRRAYTENILYCMMFQMQQSAAKKPAPSKIDEAIVERQKASMKAFVEQQLPKFSLAFGQHVIAEIPAGGVVPLSGTYTAWEIENNIADRFRKSI